MMKNSMRLVISSGVAIGAAWSAAHATQPPDPTSSDGYYNTAAGSYALYYETNGTLNTGIGYESLIKNTTGSRNTALGASALFSNVSGIDNTATGTYALHLNSTGQENVSSGSYSMYYNTAGGYNVSTGSYSMQNNTIGSENVASGFSALNKNLGGSENVVSGAYAMYFNTSGYGNTASGYFAMENNGTGYYNVGLGFFALLANVSGDSNVAVGPYSLYSNVNGSGNVALGPNSLYNSGGSNNIAIGNQAGFDVKGSNNIEIGSEGTAADAGVIRLGTPGVQNTVYVAGIATSKITGSAVYVTSSGKLGVLASSERYKTAIASMGTRTEKLSKLRPVTFHLKNDPQGEVQFGLIAEEVDKVYPELVIRDEAGKIQGVRYDELAPMLLNEMQQQKVELRTIKQQMAELTKTNESMQAALAALQGAGQRLAMR